MQNQWGGTLGGPIVRNKLFFFGSHEQTNRESDVSRFFTVPTAEARRGDFSSYGTTIYDPLTGNPRRFRPHRLRQQHHPAGAG